MKLKWIFCALALFSSQSFAAFPPPRHLEIQGSTFLFDSDIYGDTFDLVSAQIMGEPVESIKSAPPTHEELVARVHELGLTQISVNSQGGDVKVGSELLALINDSGLEMVVADGHLCQSVCGMMFLAAHQKHADAGAKFLFHKARMQVLMMSCKDLRKGLDLVKSIFGKSDPAAAPASVDEQLLCSSSFARLPEVQEMNGYLEKLPASWKEPIFQGQDVNVTGADVIAQGLAK